jgi:glycosyltransferase WbpL
VTAAWLLAVFVVSAGVSMAAVVAVRLYSVRHAIIDVPNERSSHAVPTPRGGGLAIVAVVVAGACAYALLTKQGAGWFAAGYLPGALLVAAASWVEDMRPIPMRWRFLIHAVAATLAIVAIGDFRLMAIPGIGQFDVGWLGVVLALLWIAGLTNAYNFMDGIDGIAGSQALIAGVLWTFVAWHGGHGLLGILALLLAASNLGFLVHNWPPARIFMGDVGSAFTGYTLAVITLVATQEDARLGALGLLVVAPFVFDALFTIIRRWYRGENYLTPHRAHLYQRLTIAGLSHRTVTVLYGALALTCAGFGLLWLRLGESAGLVTLAMVVLIFSGLCTFVSRLEAGAFGMRRRAG